MNQTSFSNKIEKKMKKETHIYLLNKKNIGLFLVSFLFVSASLVNAQQRTASIQFKEESFDFGKIKEADGPVTHVFSFTNTGSIPLVIQNAQPSCGCTTPDWTKQPVMPGAKGFIKATFDPSGRPGTFDKTVTVFSNADRPSIPLKFNGTVVPKPPSVESEYRMTIGDLRVTTNYISFGKLFPGAKKDTVVKVINSGKDPVTVKFVNIPEALKAVANPEVLKPGQKGTLVLSYDAGKKKDWGFLIDYLSMSLNNKPDQSYRMTVSASIEEDFSKLTPQQLANAPKIKFDNATYNFGTVKEGQKVEYDFPFKNEGKSNLMLRKVETSCGCTTTTPKDMSVKPGTSSSLHVVFNTTGKKNVQNKTITIVSNDPANPRLTLWLKGTVE